MLKMLEKIFYTHGFFCASHPWEVIVFTLTLTLSILCMGNQLNSNTICVWSKNCSSSDFDKNAYIIFMTIIRCTAVLYIVHQFRNLRKLGSKYLLGIALLFTVFSSFVFSNSVIKFFQGDFAELNEALPIFLLLIDLSKASLLAQFALTSSNQKEVRDNIARGMSLLGPTITLDTVVDTLVIGVGPLSGVKRLEVMCCFACLSVIVNYLVFMTFFPACLSLILELSRDVNVWQVTSFARSLQENEHKPNLILQRVKLIMSAGLSLVHVHSRWPIITELHSSPEVAPPVHPNYISEESMLVRWFCVSPDQVVILILVLSLAIKYIFFESYNSEEIIMPVLSENEDLTPSSTICSSNSSLTSERKIDYDTKCTQTTPEDADQTNNGLCLVPSEPRPIEDCFQILKSACGATLTDDEIFSLLTSKRIASYQLESVVNDPLRAVVLRRRLMGAKLQNESAMANVPFCHYDYSDVTGVCCENVIGYMPVPLGVAGPLLMNGKEYYIPMATTEGCLIASTNRGCSALMRSGGVKGFLLNDSMTRGPAVRFSSVDRAVAVCRWLKRDENYEKIKSTFDSTSRFARLRRLKPTVTGRDLYIRFEAETGDAMGMNMLSKGTERALEMLKEEFQSDIESIVLSGNYCTDKKSAAINWIDGRGKGIVCCAVIPGAVVREVLKTSVSALVDLNIRKNFVGSAMAGAMGGFNAQAANIVAATFIATGQDPAQIVGSSNCITLMERDGSTGNDLHISITMPSLEVGTVGGGTSLASQAACLDILGVKGSCDENPGQNAATLALVIGGTVLAGELSLMSCLAAGQLVKSHMMYNRIPRSR